MHNNQNYYEVRPVDMIYKASAVMLQRRRLLVVRPYNRSIFIAPGGKVSATESPEEGLTRELEEELCVKVEIRDLEFFSRYYDQAAGEPEAMLCMDVFAVRKWRGDVSPSNEIEEVRWISSSELIDIDLGSIFRDQVIPKLKTKGVVD